jgi:hypothetical protein
MFGRRVASSLPIPQAMYSALHLSSRKQALRVLPPLVPLASQIAKVVASSIPSSNGGAAPTTESCASAVMDMMMIGMSQQAILRLFTHNPQFLQLLTDTICCTYSVIFFHIVMSKRSNGQRCAGYRCSGEDPASIRQRSEGRERNWVNLISPNALVVD